jgi:DNA-binding response OmpR family regulator
VTPAKRRILFVDNRPEYMHQPVLRLRLEGYRVEEATSGEDALALLHQGSYDLLILDAELPDSDGWEVLRTVRADADLKDQKVIVLMAGQGETGKLVLVPVDAELRRPFNMAQLVETVRRVLQEEGSTSAS